MIKSIIALGVLKLDGSDIGEYVLTRGPARGRRALAGFRARGLAVGQLRYFDVCHLQLSLPLGFYALYQILWDVLLSTQVYVQPRQHRLGLTLPLLRFHILLHFHILFPLFLPLQRHIGDLFALFLFYGVPLQEIALVVPPEPIDLPALLDNFSQIHNYVVNGDQDREQDAEDNGRDARC